MFPCVSMCNLIMHLLNHHDVKSYTQLYKHDHEQSYHTATQSRSCTALLYYTATRAIM